jgi:hypothetical protein
VAVNVTGSTAVVSSSLPALSTSASSGGSVVADTVDDAHAVSRTAVIAANRTRRDRGSGVLFMGTSSCAESDGKEAPRRGRLSHPSTSRTGFPDGVRASTDAAGRNDE